MADACLSVWLCIYPCKRDISKTMGNLTKFTVVEQFATKMN